MAPVLRSVCSHSNVLTVLRFQHQEGSTQKHSHRHPAGNTPRNHPKPEKSTKLLDIHNIMIGSDIAVLSYVAPLLLKSGSMISDSCTQQKTFQKRWQVLELKNWIKASACRIHAPFPKRIAFSRGVFSTVRIWLVTLGHSSCPRNTTENIVQCLSAEEGKSIQCLLYRVIDAGHRTGTSKRIAHHLFLWGLFAPKLGVWDEVGGHCNFPGGAWAGWWKQRSQISWHFCPICFW